MNRPEKLSREHWQWLSSTLEKVYVDAFEHGYKHGHEDALRGEEK